LEKVLREALPRELASHVFLLNVQGETLVLGSDTQALITPLRFQAPLLLAAARKVLKDSPPVRVAWRTMPHAMPEKTALHPQRPSAEVASNLESAAGSVEDPQLSAALHRLASAMRKAPK
jgi:hypothetical protein